MGNMTTVKSIGSTKYVHRFYKIWKVVIVPETWKMANCAHHENPQKSRWKEADIYKLVRQSFIKLPKAYVGFSSAWWKTYTRGILRKMLTLKNFQSLFESFSDIVDKILSNSNSRSLSFGKTKPILQSPTFISRH